MHCPYDPRVDWSSAVVWNIHASCPLTVLFFFYLENKIAIFPGAISSDSITNHSRYNATVTARSDRTDGRDCEIQANHLDTTPACRC